LSFDIESTTSILNSVDIMWLTENNVSRSKTHPTTCTTLYVFTGLPSSTINFTLMLTHTISIHFQLPAMAPKCSHRGKGKATARTIMPTLVVNWCLLLDQAQMKRFNTDKIRGLIWIYNVRGVKDVMAWNCIYDIMFIDPVTTRHISQFQLMWPHHRSRSSSFQERCAVFNSYMGQMFHKT
jgi:hypothetical protein